MKSSRTIRCSALREAGELVQFLVKVKLRQPPFQNRAESPADSATYGNSGALGEPRLGSCVTDWSALAHFRPCCAAQVRSSVLLLAAAKLLQRSRKPIGLPGLVRSRSSPILRWPERGKGATS